MTHGVMPGAEPASFPGGPGGALVLHGFTGNPQSMRGLAEALAAAGIHVEMPLLPGHGTALEDMVPTRWNDWSSAAEAAWTDLRSVSDQVVVVGLSMGATLGCWLASRHEIAGLVAVNPLIEPPAESFREMLQGALDSGVEVSPGVGSDISRPGVEESAYEGAPIAAALSMFEAVERLSTSLDKIGCPVLLFTSRQDHVVPTASSDVLAAGVKGPVEHVWLDRSYHVATLDWERELIESRTVDFARKVLSM